MTASLTLTGDTVSACSSLAARARSGAQEIESFLSGRVDPAELHQLRSLAWKLQQLGMNAANLDKKLRDGQAASPELQRPLSTEVSQCNDTAAIIIKQLMRPGTDTPQDAVSVAAVLLYESFAEAATRFLAFAAQVLAIDSIEIQNAQIQSQDARLILGAVASARHDISRSSGILLDIEAVSHATATKDGDTSGAQPPGYAVYEHLSPASEAGSDSAQTRSTLPKYDAGVGGSKNKGSDGGFLNSLTGPLRAATAALRSKPEPLVSALCQAAASGHTSQIRSLLAEGANIDGRNEDGQTALVCAVRADQPESIQTLLGSGADTGGKGRPPLFHAVDLQNRPVAQLLLRHGADPNQKDSWGQRYFLALVMGSTPPEWIALLLSYGADASAKDQSGQAPVILAVRRRKRKEDREEVVRLLVQHGAGVSTRDTDGTPLVHLCLQQQRRGLAIELLSLGADPNAKDVSGISLLEAVIKNHNDLELAKAVLDKGADPNVKDFHGYHLLFSVLGETSSAAADKSAFAMLLLEHGARGGEKDFHGVTALERALLPIIRGSCARSSFPPAGDKLKIPELLLKQGASPNQRLTEVDGEPTVLAYAIERGLWDVAALVLRYRAAVNAVDKDGRTPLVQAVQKGNAVAVDMLLRHGANVNQPGPTLPLDVAAAMGNAEVVEMLKQNGAVGKGEVGG